MFVISQSKTYRYPVTFKTPKEDGTGTDDHSFMAVFKRLGVDEIVELQIKKGLTDKIFVKAVMVGWHDVVDESGAPVEFSPSLFETLLDRPGFASACGKAFNESLEGAPRKN